MVFFWEVYFKVILGVEKEAPKVGDYLLSLFSLSKLSNKSLIYFVFVKTYSDT
jgi:hypothetical protein